MVNVGKYTSKVYLPTCGWFLMVNVGKYTSPMDCLGTHPPPGANVVKKKQLPSCLEQFAPHLDRWSGKPNPTGCDRSLV